MPTPIAPSHVLFTLLDVRLFWLVPKTRALLTILVEARGTFNSADALAWRVGLKSRHQLAHLLEAEGLPNLRRLAAWIRILIWHWDCEGQGLRLCRGSLNEAKDPAFRYRLVKRVTGEDWSTVRARGVDWLFEEFLTRCRRPSSGEVRQNVV